MEILNAESYLNRMLAAPRPGADQVLAFYEHRIGAVCRDPALMLMPWDDHLVHRGDGVFETVKWTGRRVYLLDRHLDRMALSSQALGLDFPCSREELREIVLAVARAADAENGLLRLLLGRGPGGFGLDPAECPTPSLYVVAYRYTPKPESWYAKGATAFRTSIPAKQRYLSIIKSVNYLPNVLMKREAVAKGADFPLCFDDRGLLAEGATENVALVDASGALVIPELVNALAGTTLLRALELTEGELPRRFAPVREDEVFEARELLLLGTTPRCLALVAYDGRPVGDGKPGPVSRRLREVITRDEVENGMPL